MIALVIVVVIGGINLLAAGQYGEIEAWLSMVKIMRSSPSWPSACS